MTDNEMLQKGSHRRGAGAILAGILLLVGAEAMAESEVRLDVRPGRPSRTEAVTPLDLSRLEPGPLLRGTGPDTARVMVILVEFPEDTDPNTTGDGRFELEPSTRYSINQPPHDAPYFDRQMRAGANYYRAATEGRLTLTWEIFPGAGDDPSAYEMPQRMRYYNPDTTESALNERLAAFFRDAIEAADAGGARFTDTGGDPRFDHTLIFHAGVGQDLLLADNTPSDIPSAFLSFEELREYLGEDEGWEGIPVEGGAHRVREGLWLPETENQEGFEFAITGVFAQLYGSQLGLPILWNPDSGAPGIGRFGLMDQGGGNLNGQVPALPCAWSRLDRGWADVVVVTDTTDIRVRARGALHSGADLVLIPVDEREYFLIENRKKDVDGDGELTIQLEQTVPIGVVADEYDFGIPGSGLLIWHIDQGQIDANRQDNRVNADFTQRGVKLLEADGLDDIGFREEGGFGLPEDCYYLGNNTELTSTTNPSSASNYGALTHVAVTAISDSGLVMTCSVSNDVFLPGFPDTSGVAYQSVSPARGDVDGDGQTDLVVVDSLYARVRHGDGSGWTGFPLDTGGGPDRVLIMIVDDVANTPCSGCDEIVLAQSGAGLRFLSFDPGTRTFGVSAVQGGEGAVLTSGDLDGVAPRELCVGWADSIQVYRDGGPAGPALVTGDGTDVVHAAIVPGLGDAALVHVSRGGRIVGVSASVVDGNPQMVLEAETSQTLTFPPVFGDLDDDGTVDVVTIATDGTVTAWRRLDGGAVAGLEPIAGWPARVEGPVGPLALGDIDADGRLDVLFGGANTLYALGFNGVRLEQWPITLTPFDDAGVVEAEPLIADVDGDGDQDVILASPDGTVRAYSGAGQALPGWPLPAGAANPVTPVVADVGGGSFVQVGAGGPWLYGYRVAGAHQAAQWPARGGGASGSGVFFGALEPSGAPSGFFPEESLYAYPNPTAVSVRFRYFVSENATVEIKIYDASGSAVATLTGEALGPAMNETAWDLVNTNGVRVAPGLYVARVTARGGAQTSTHQTKIAVFR